MTGKMYEHLDFQMLFQFSQFSQFSSGKSQQLKNQFLFFATLN